MIDAHGEGALQPPRSVVVMLEDPATGVGGLPRLLEEVTLENGKLRVRVRRPVGLDDTANINVQLAGHDDVESSWRASIPPTIEGESLATELDVQPDWGVLEVSAIVVPGGNSWRAGTDFEHEYFVERDGDLLTGDAAAAVLRQVRANREALYHQPIGTGSGRYRAIVLAEGIRLTTDLRVPGLEIRRLMDSTRGVDVAEILNAVLAQLAFGVRVTPESWAKEHEGRRPTIVVVAEDVRADIASDAARTVASAADDVLGLLALQRDAAPTILAGMVESVGVDPPRVSGWSGVPHYGGNLLGGFISGESQSDLVGLYQGLQGDDVLRLWLALHRDALAEERWDFRFFRHFNLLETMARRVLGEGAPVVGFDGIPIIGGDGKPVTTSTAAGKVFALLKLWSERSQSAEMNLATPGAASLWEEVQVWVGIRNAVAHDGAYRADSGERIPSAKRVGRALDRLQAADPVGEPAGHYLRMIQDGTKLIVAAFLYGRLELPS